MESSCRLRYHACDNDGSLTAELGRLLALQPRFCVQTYREVASYGPPAPAYWRVIFDYPPFNVIDDTMFQSLQDLLARMDVSSSLRVMVFESANQ